MRYGIGIVTGVAFLAMGLAVVGCTSPTSNTTAPTGSTSSAPQAPPSSSTTSAPAATDAQAVLKQQCGLCHSLDRIYLQPDSTDWAAVIARMDANHSKTFATGWAEMSAAKRQEIITFLQSRTMSAGEKLVRQKCVTCHPLTNITVQASGTDWSAIVDRMITKYGASLTANDKEAIVAFLSQQ
jgi:mono/diheme cytochrome c family protein